MDIYWIPPHVETIERDLRFLTNTWQMLIRYARLHSSYTARGWRRSELCQHCTINDATNLHHQIPLWVFSVEAIAKCILTLPLATPAQHFSIHCLRLVDQGDSLFPPWHSIENCVSLCRPCHERAESKAHKFYKEKLLQKYYPLLHWDRQSAEKAFAEIEKWGMKYDHSFHRRHHARHGVAR